MKISFLLDFRFKFGPFLFEFLGMIERITENVAGTILKHINNTQVIEIINFKTETTKHILKIPGESHVIYYTLQKLTLMHNMASLPVINPLEFELGTSPSKKQNQEIEYQRVYNSTTTDPETGKPHASKASIFLLKGSLSQRISSFLLYNRRTELTTNLDLVFKDLPLDETTGIGIQLSYIGYPDFVTVYGGYIGEINYNHKPGEQKHIVNHLFTDQSIKLTF